LTDHRGRILVGDKEMVVWHLRAAPRRLPHAGSPGAHAEGL